MPHSIYESIAIRVLTGGKVNADYTIVPFVSPIIPTLVISVYEFVEKREQILDLVRFHTSSGMSIEWISGGFVTMFDLQDLYDETDVHAKW